MATRRDATGHNHPLCWSQHGLGMGRRVRAPGGTIDSALQLVPRRGGSKGSPSPEWVNFRATLSLGEPVIRQGGRRHSVRIGRSTRGMEFRQSSIEFGDSVRGSMRRWLSPAGLWSSAV